MKRNKTYSKALAFLLTVLLIFQMGNMAVFAQGNADESSHQLPQDNLSLLNGDEMRNTGDCDFSFIYGPPKKQAGLQARSVTPFTEIKNIVIFVDFMDVNADGQLVAPENFMTQNCLNSAQAAYNTGDSSMKKYISTMSYGELTVDTYFFPQSGTQVLACVDPHAANYYRPRSSDNPNGYLGAVYDPSNPDMVESDTMMYRENQLLENAMSAVKTQVEAQFTANQLDNNNDGKVDSVTFITDSPYDLQWAELLWPHQYEVSGSFFHNKEISRYNLASATEPSYGVMNTDGAPGKSGTITHEFMHTLGLPDLYPYKSTNEIPVGTWDVMGENNYSAPQNMTQYMQREVMGWGTPIDKITSNGTYTLKVAGYEDAATDGGAGNTPETAYIIPSPYTSTEFFVVEYRKKIGFDKNLLTNPLEPSDGILVYRVNTLLAEEGNMYSPPYYMQVMGLYYYTGIQHNPTMSQESGNISFGKSGDSTKMLLSNRMDSGIIIDNVGSNTGDTITFNVTFPDSSWYPQGQGTESNPYLITNAHHLTHVSYHMNSHYKMMNDVDLSAYEEWPTIVYPSAGSYSLPSTAMHYDSAFQGVFDGNGHTISNMKNTSTYVAVLYNGLFAEIGSNGIVRNLNLEDCDVQTPSYYTGVVASIVSGTVENVNVIGGCAYGDLKVGGITGLINPGAVINNCTTSATVGGAWTGGIAGAYLGGQVTNCGASGAVTQINPGPVEALFGVRDIRSDYQECSGLYWDVQKTGCETAAYVALDPNHPERTGLEGMVGISIPELYTIDPDEDVAIQVATIPANAQAPDISWDVQNTNIATITSDGVIQNVNPGITSAIGSLNFGTITMPIIRAVRSNFVITMKANSGYAVRNGSVFPLTIYNGQPATPLIVDGTAMIPVRFIAEATGIYAVDWDDVQRTITITDKLNGDYYELQIGSQGIWKNDKNNAFIGSITMPVPAQVINGVTYVPLRSLLEFMGCQVGYSEYSGGAYFIVSNCNSTLTQQAADSLAAAASGLI